jgi:hypothetical protein
VREVASRVGGAPTIEAVRALERFRWFLPALAIPVCAGALGIGVQAVAFGRAPKDSLVATKALRELVRYRVMRGVESLDGRRLTTTCIQGRFRLPRSRRLAPGALVLLGNGERLYDVGSGVRRLVRFGRSRPAGLENRVRFVLAACPNYVGDHIAGDLTRGRPVEAVDERSDGASAAAIIAGSRHATLILDVTRVTYKPLSLSFSEGRFRGSSDLVPGGGAWALRRVQDAFDLVPRRGHVRA